jgi:hypothetical protein
MVLGPVGVETSLGANYKPCLTIHLRLHVCA